MVKVYIDVITGDEMVSDGYPNKEIFNGAGLEVQARFITKGQDDGGIAMNLGEDEEKGADAGGMPEGETVIDIVDRFDLKETKYDKKSFQAYVKVYLNKIKKYLQDKGKAERVPEFQKGVLEMVKMILKNFDDFQFFTGSSMDDEAALALCTYPEGKTEPVFYFFLDGLEGKEY
eukprot:TRINITY_DN0_c223_g1_i8.p1 TRINITY_DN0_c223_g1~~TRINITY_DN0_c223_g1_i8.p1  ORF type:complete len:174 (-),score=70.18 TRINITY_DN0_c223_g1_i8:48-569(-)